MSADQENPLERVAALHAALKVFKPGKSDGGMQGLVQEALAILTAFPKMLDVVEGCIRALVTILNFASAATLLRLEGGLDYVMRAVRRSPTHRGIVAAGAKMMAKMAAGSSVAQVALVKDADIGQVLLRAMKGCMADLEAVTSLFEVLAHVSRYAKGAKALVEEAGAVKTMEQCLLRYQNRLETVEPMLKTFKNLAKHKESVGALQDNVSVVASLWSCAKFLCSVQPPPDKLMKRASRCLWLLRGGTLLPALPPMEPAWPLPPRNAPHLLLPCALDGDQSHLRTLLPEEGGAWAQQESTPAQPVRPPTELEQGPVPAADLSTQAANVASVLLQPSEPFHPVDACRKLHMMFHDLQRIYKPQEVINAVVYQNSHSAVLSDAAAEEALAAVAVEAGGDEEALGGDDEDDDPEEGPAALAAAEEGKAAKPKKKLVKRKKGAALSSSGKPPLARKHSGAGGGSGADSRLGLAAAAAAAPALAAEEPEAEVDLEGEAEEEAALAEEGEEELEDGGIEEGLMEADGAGSSSRASMQQLSDEPSAGSRRSAAGSQRPGISRRASDADSEGMAPLRSASSLGSLHSSVEDPCKGGTEFTGQPMGVPPDPTHQLQFESRFESGNLRQAVHIYANEYDLFLAPDLNDRSEAGNLCQWFYFAVSNVVPGTAYKFNVVNFRKKDSLFASGCAPLVCQGRPLAPATDAPALPQLGAKQGGPAGWRRAGSAITYYPSCYRGRVEKAANAPSKPPSAQGERKKGGRKPALKASAGSTKLLTPGFGPIGPGLYAATFTLTFPLPGTWYVASSYPYTYTDLQQYLARLEAAATLRTALSGPTSSLALPLVRSTLCHTLAGHRCDLLTITNFGSPPEAIQQREYVVLTARVHPGETNASWIVQGAIAFLTSSDPQAAALRDNFVFKVVPMLNPDGVVNGSYRCSLAGCDLNRAWARPLRYLHPTIFHTKKLMAYLATDGRLALYIDIHGHSRKNDAFFYGCEPQDKVGSAPAPPPPLPEKLPPVPTVASLGLVAAGGQPPQQQAGAGNGAGGPMQVLGSSFSRLAVAPSGGSWSSQGAGQLALEAELTPEASATLITPKVAARLRVRMLPWLASKLSGDYNFTSCTFKIQKSKLNAARVVACRELGVAGSYTLEASLGGQGRSRCHFSVRDYMQMGTSLCRAIAALGAADDSSLLEDMMERIQLPPL